jgi:O-acetyl-ADP-ribose deacetylase (regulator of RNase III)
MSGAHNLNNKFKRIAHVVGPVWNEKESQKCIKSLKRGINMLLINCEIEKYQSVAIPAISSGIFGFPKEKVAHCILRAIDRY